MTTGRRIRREIRLSTAALTVAGWGLLVWLAIDMTHPLAQLMMPPTTAWSPANTLAVLAMWAVMMGAMMLPSALPMILTFGDLCLQRGEPARWRSFIAAYLLIWSLFSALATGLQWGFQAAGWISPMMVSTSRVLTGVLLLVAGVYQFSPLKRLCLARCRTPLGFLIGEWRPGTRGGFVMGWRHGLFCVGCCWVLMALLFVGGVMNLAWIAAVSLAVALEKLWPGGQRLSLWLGVVLLIGGAARLTIAM
jgi:predicted metal-binding membrane protein